MSERVKEGKKNNLLHNVRGNYSIYEVKIAKKGKLYENFHIFHFQKRIVSMETICGNTANGGPHVEFNF